MHPPSLLRTSQTESQLNLCLFGRGWSLGSEICGRLKRKPPVEKAVLTSLTKEPLAEGGHNVRFNSVQTRCIVKTRGFTRGVCNNRRNYSTQRFSCGIPIEQAVLRKSKTPRKSPEKRIFLSLAFYNVPSLHTVNRCSLKRRYSSRVVVIQKVFPGLS